MNVGIVSNSPGEIAGWAIPASVILKNLGFNVDLYLTPCMFATKKEYDVAFRYGSFERIFTPDQTLKKIFFNPLKYEIFFHMGGEIWYSTRFKSRRLISYGWATKRLDRYFSGYLVPNDYYYRKLVSRQIDEKKIIKIKDLVFEKLNPVGYNVDSNLVGFMLGSREVEFWGLLEIYLKTVPLLDMRYNFLFFVSPFVYEIYSEDLKNRLFSFGKQIMGNEFSKHFGRIRFVFNEPEKYDLLSKVKLLVTIPGTKTNEAGYLGIPQLVILPLQRPECVPIWGVVGWLDFLGIIGKKIKGYFVVKYAEKNILTRKRFISMPNIISNEYILPEVAGIITHINLSEKINEILDNKVFLIHTSQKLRSIYKSWDNESISFKEFIEIYCTEFNKR
ncbi:MAG: hypothetical protein N2169_05875 [bacterium]|nr:hypothetical protein [bacterium]